MTTTASTGPLSLLLKEWRLLVFGLLMTFWSSPGQTFFISLFGGQIRTDLGLSHGGFGGIYSAATLASAFLMIWTGPLVDRIDLRKISVLVVAALAIGCGLLSISHTVPLLVLSIFLLRHAGQGLMFLCSTTAMVRYLEPVKGKASSLSGMGYPLGEAILPSVIVMMLGAFAWRSSWQIFVVILLVLIVPLILLLLRNHHLRHSQYLENLQTASLNPDKAGRKTQWTRAEVVRDLKFYLFLPGLLSQPLMFTGFIFHQVHLVQSKGWSLSMWGSLFVIYAIVSVVFNLICGVLIDRYGASRILPYFPIPLAIGLLTLSGASSESAALIFMVLTGVTVGMSSPLSTPFFVELYGSQHIGAIKSLSTATMVLFSALSPVVLGLFFDFGVSVETLAFCGALYIFLTSALAWWTCRKFVWKGPLFT